MPKLRALASHQVRWVGVGLLLSGLVGVLALLRPVAESAPRLVLALLALLFSAPTEVTVILFLTSLLPVIGLVVAAGMGVAGLLLLLTPARWTNQTDPDLPLPERLPPEE